MDCSPSALMRAARCFHCLGGLQWAVRSYLLCQWANEECTDPIVVDWLNRIELGGAPRPSDQTINAVCNFVKTLRAQNLVDKFYAINPFIPDSLEAMMYPLYSDVNGPIGLSPWTNNNFLPGDLNGSGLRGADTKYLDTGVLPANVDPVGRTLTLALYECEVHTPASTGREIDIGAYSLVNQSEDVWAELSCWEDAYWSIGSVASTAIYSPTHVVFNLQPDIPAFYLSCRQADGNVMLYRGNQTSGFSQIATAFQPTTGQGPECTFYVFAIHALTPGISDIAEAFSTKRLAFAWIGTELTGVGGESQALYNAVIALRAALPGGGTCPIVPTADVILPDGIGGFWKLIVDNAGNVGTQPDPGPATPDVILRDPAANNWKVVVDNFGLRGTQLDINPQTDIPVFMDGLGQYWYLVVDIFGNLGTQTL